MKIEWRGGWHKNLENVVSYLFVYNMKLFPKLYIMIEI